MDDPHLTPSEALDALHERARSILPDSVLAYYDSGAGDSITLDEATAAWDTWRLRPRVLRDVTDVSTTTTVLGTHHTQAKAANLVTEDKIRINGKTIHLGS